MSLSRLFSWMVLDAICLMVTMCQSSKSQPCEVDSFYNFASDRCERCSECPSNQVIKKPCSKFSDLECEPFRNFNDFPNFVSAHQSSYQDTVEYSEDKIFEFESGLSSSEGSSRNQVNDGPTTIEKGDKEYWKTLAFALISLVSILIIVATVVVLLVCRKLQRATVGKQPDEGDADDTDSGYVVIRAIRHMTDLRPVNTNLYTQEDCHAHPPLLPCEVRDSAHTSNETGSGTDSQQPLPGRLRFLPKMYTPQRRLLTYDADDVFESDDGGGSLSRSSNSKRLHAISEKL